MINIITDSELISLENKGYLLIKNFFSKEDLTPLMDEMTNLAIAFGMAKNKIDSYREIDELFVDIIKNNHKLKPFIYDRLQLMPQLLKIPSNDKIQNLSKTILKTNGIGVWPRMQLRLDLANDSKNLIEWHTDYLYNRGTSDSYTFWIPLVSINKDMGPIKMVSGSHKKEYSFVLSTEERRHAFTLETAEKQKLKITQIDQFNAGDLIVFHSKFLHSGEINRVENRARLVCVFRMQNINKLEILSGDKND